MIFGCGPAVTREPPHSATAPDPPVLHTGQSTVRGYAGADVDGWVEQLSPAQAKQVTASSWHDLHHTDGAGGADNMWPEIGPIFTASATLGVTLVVLVAS